mmetsp:Transcript_21553/g.63801  ORF Transcript_21553/g.63801 Transcript_21553/m.63801 type:complete len:204 (-) Transcript_21553:47-658(-)
MGILPSSPSWLRSMISRVSRIFLAYGLSESSSRDSFCSSCSRTSFGLTSVPESSKIFWMIGVIALPQKLGSLMLSRIWSAGSGWPCRARPPSCVRSGGGGVGEAGSSVVAGSRPVAEVGASTAGETGRLTAGECVGETLGDPDPSGDMDPSLPKRNSSETCSSPPLDDAGEGERGIRDAFAAGKESLFGSIFTRNSSSSLMVL